MTTKPYSDATSAQDVQVALLAAVNNFLVIWSLYRSRSDSLAAQALNKADRQLFNAFQEVRHPHLQDNPSLSEQYAAVDDFLKTWSVLGALVLPDWRPYAPVLDDARLRLQSAFHLENEPSVLL
jgi:hypothetical protein